MDTPELQGSTKLRLPAPLPFIAGNRCWRMDNTRIVGYRNDGSLVYSGDNDYLLNYLGGISGAQAMRRLCMMSPYQFDSYRCDQADYQVNYTAEYLHIIGHKPFSSRTPGWEDQYREAVKGYNDIFSMVLR